MHRRPIQNVFGPFVLHRVVYGTREGQKIEAVPLDQRLRLPHGKNSYLRTLPVMRPTRLDAVLNLTLAFDSNAIPLSLSCFYPLLTL